MKKYSRIIRKSYFPNLFFRQDCKSSCQRKTQVFLLTRFDFHNNILFLKNFLSGSHKEKTNLMVVLPPKLKIPGLQSHIQTNEKYFFFKSGPGRQESQDSKYGSKRFPFSSPYFRNKKSTLLRSLLSGFAPAVLIYHDSPSNLKTSNSRYVNPDISESSFLNSSSAVPIFPGPHIIKAIFSENSLRSPIFKIKSRTPILKKPKAFFLQSRSAPFTQFALHPFPKINVQNLENSTSFPPVYLPFPLFIKGDLVPVIFNKNLRNMQELKPSANSISGKDTLTTKSGPEFKASLSSKLLLGLLTKFFSFEYLDGSKGLKRAVKSTLKRPYVDVQQPEKKGWKEKSLIAGITKQDNQEIIDEGLLYSIAKNYVSKIGPSIWAKKFNAPGFLTSLNKFEKMFNYRKTERSTPPLYIQLLRHIFPANSNFFYWTGSPDSKSSKIAQNILHERKIDKIKFSKRVDRKVQLSCEVFSSNKSIIAAKTLEKPNKNLFEAQNSFLKPNISCFLELYRQPGFRNLRRPKDCELQDLNSILTHKFDWLTILKYKKSVSLPLNSQVIFTSGAGKAAPKLDQEGIRALDSKTFFELKSQMISNPINEILSLHSHKIIQPLYRVINYAKIHLFSYIYRYNKSLEPDNYSVRMTRIPEAEASLFTSHTMNLGNYKLFNPYFEYKINSQVFYPFETYLRPVFRNLSDKRDLMKEIRRDREQDHEESIGMGNGHILVQNIIVPSSVQFPIRNFLKKIPNFFIQAYSANSKNILINRNKKSEQRKDSFYSKEHIKEIFPTVKKLSTEKGISRKFLTYRRFSAKRVFPVRVIQRIFNKSLLTPKKECFKKVLPYLPYSPYLDGFYGQKPVSKEFLVTIALLANNNENVSTGVFGLESASTFAGHKNKESMALRNSRTCKISQISEKAERLSFSLFSGGFQQYLQRIFQANASILDKTLTLLPKEQVRNLQFIPEQDLSLILGSKNSKPIVTFILNYLDKLNSQVPVDFQQNPQNSQFHWKAIPARIKAEFTELKLKLQETHKSESTFLADESHLNKRHLEIKSTCRILVPFFNIKKHLLIKNNLTQLSRIYTAYSMTDIAQGKKSHSQNLRFQETFKFLESLQLFPLLQFFNVAPVDGEVRAYKQKMPSFQETNRVGTSLLERETIQLRELTKARIFENLMGLKVDFTKENLVNYLMLSSIGVKTIYSSIRKTFQIIHTMNVPTFPRTKRRFKDYKTSTRLGQITNFIKDNSFLFDSLKNIHYSDNRKMENGSAKRAEKHYFSQFIQMNELKNKFIHSGSLQILNKSTYKLKKPKILSNILQSLMSNEIAASIFGLKEAYTDFQQKNKIQTTAIYERLFPFTQTANPSPFRIQNNSAFYADSPVSLNKGISKHFRLLYSPLEIEILSLNYFSSIPDFSILSKALNPVPGNRPSLNFLFSDRLSGVSTSFFSRISGAAFGEKTLQIHNLLNSIPSAVSQNSVSDKKEEFSSNFEIRSSKKKNLKSDFVFLASLNGKKMPGGDQVSSRKRGRVNSSLVCKRAYGSAGSFLRLDPTNFLGRKNRIEKGKQNIASLNSQMKLGISAEIIRSVTNNFSLQRKQKMTLSVSPVAENKPDASINGFKGFSPESKPFRDSGRLLKSVFPFKSRNIYYDFHKGVSAGETYGPTAFWVSENKRPELMHMLGYNLKNDREDLVYGPSQILMDEVKKIEKIVIETKESVANHFESHLKQMPGKAGQVIDIEKISDKIMQQINRRLKIEAERRGIFCQMG